MDLVSRLERFRHACVDVRDRVKGEIALQLEAKVARSIESLQADGSGGKLVCR